MTNILLVAYSFPPLLEATAILNGKLTRSLSEDEFRSHVVTVRPGTGVSDIDMSMAALLKPANEVYTFPSSSNWRTSRWVMVYHGLRKLCSSLERLPDLHVWDHKRAVRLSEDVIRQHRIELVISSASPFSCHLAGLTLKRRHGLPWMAYFTDPWVGNTYADYGFFDEFINRTLERMVIEQADALVFLSRAGLEATMGKYPPDLRRKARVVPPCYCEDLYPPWSPRPSEQRFVFRYLGSFYGARTPVPLFEGVAAFKSTSPKIAQTCQFHCVGPAPSSVEPQKKTYGLGKELCFSPPVGYLESLSLMKSADVLMIIDPPHEDYPFLPSKLIDYIGANRPIIGITPFNGPAAPLIRECGGIVVAPEDREGIAVGFEAMWAEHSGASASPLKNMIPQDISNRFSAKRLGTQLAEILNSLKP